MFKYIRLRREITLFERDQKFFLAKKGRGNCKGQIVPLVIDKGLLDELRNRFLEVSYLYSNLGSPEQIANFRHMRGLLFFEYKRSLDDSIIFSEKYYPENLEGVFEEEDSGSVSSKTFLRKEYDVWTIDNPLSNLSCYEENGNLSEKFLKMMEHSIFDRESQLDFKDLLMLHETRRRRDKLKGTFPQVNNYKLKNLISLKNEGIEVDTYTVPSSFRGSSKRVSKSIEKKDFLNFVGQISAQQASLFDPYFETVKKKFYPSAGSGYELKPVFFCQNIIGIKQGVYLIDEDTNQLKEIEFNLEHFNSVLASARKSWGVENGLPALVISFVLDPIFYYRKYSQICLSLSLINLGVMFRECYQIAHNLNLSACALGSTTTDRFFELTKGELISLGEFGLGGKL